MYACVCVCVCVYVCACVYVCMCVCMQVCMHVYMYYEYVYICICIQCNGTSPPAPPLLPVATTTNADDVAVVCAKVIADTHLIIRLY